MYWNKSQHFLWFYSEDTRIRLPCIKICVKNSFTLFWNHHVLCSLKWRESKLLFYFKVVFWKCSLNHSLQEKKLQFHNSTWTSKRNPSLCWIEQSCMTDVYRSIEETFAALDTSHLPPQATWSSRGQPTWTTQEEIHWNDTAGADSSKESSLWSKFADLLPPMSWDVSFFSNVGKCWAQQNLDVSSQFLQDCLYL